MNSKNNYFYFKAPFRTNFSLQTGNVLSAGNEYHLFWEKISKQNLEKTLSQQEYLLNFLHINDTTDQLQFESVSSDANTGNMVSPIVIQIKPEKWIAKKVEEIQKEFNYILPKKQKTTLCFEPSSCVISIFKNTIANMDMLFKIDLENEDISKQFMEALEEWSNKISEKLIHFFYSDFLTPLFHKIYELSHHEKYISPINDHYGFPDIGQKDKQLLKQTIRCGLPLWVSRMLILSDTNNCFDQVINQWIITTKSKEEVINNLKNHKKDDKNLVYIGWMHSIFVNNENNMVFEDVCHAISLIQYYYAILDSISMNLSQIIGISHKKKSVKEMQSYKDLLEEMVFIANLNKTEFADVKQSLQRNRAYFFNDLMNKWTVDNLFENVENKIQLCKENIDKIYQKAFNRSQKVAELLLFFISGFAILEFLKGISEFFWSADNYKDKAWGLYALGRMFDPNTMLWFGISIFLLLFIVYTRIIKRQ